MGLFSKNNDKGMATVIECRVEDGLLVKKSEIEDFYTGTQLIVHESQQALFFLNGQALDSFTRAGKYTLETQTLPVLTSLLNLPLKGKQQFRAELYFVNCAEQMGIRWGTDTPITFTDKVYNIPFELGARGELSLKVKDARRFVTKLVGTQSSMDREKTAGFFEAFVKSRVGTHLPLILEENNVSILGVDKYITICSEQVQEHLREDLEAYGLDLPMFRIVGYKKPVEDSNYQRLLQLTGDAVIELGRSNIEAQKERIRQDTKARGVVVDSQAQAIKRQTEGYSYQEEKGFSVAEKLAENSAAGGMASLGVGFGAMGGMAAGAGSAMAGFAAGALAPVSGVFAKNAPGVPGVVPGGSGIGNSQSNGIPPALELRKSDTPTQNTEKSAMDDLRAQIDQLKMLKESGLMSDEEFETARKNLISKVMK